MVLESVGGGGSPQGITNFEAHSHQQLRDMLAAANPETLKTHADLLKDVAGAVGEIGEDLRTYIKSVPWEGEAGKAFEAWGEQTWKATMLLGEYAAVGGTWMGEAAQTLSEVKKNLPKVDKTALGNLDAATEYPKDPDSKKVSSDARSKLHEDHADAVQQMNKLAQSYSLAAFVIKQQEPPSFAPPPEAFVPTGDYYGGSDESWSSGSTGGGGGTSGDYASSARYNSTESRNVPSASVGQLESQTPTPSRRRPVNMEIDGVAALPESHFPSVDKPSIPSAGRADAGPSSVPGLIPPAFGGGYGGVHPPGGVRSPSLSGQGLLGSGPGARIPRESGIVGGRPVMPTSDRSAGGIPRGTVVGGEGVHGRSPAPGGMGMGGSAGAQGGISGGRRLAGETGGVVGARGQQAGARPFTPGGSGLVRGQAADGGARTGRGGVVPPRVRGSGRDREDENGQRPDYLTEDEETWQQGSRRIVPPVID